jgi:hypothetical protein
MTGDAFREIALNLEGAVEKPGRSSSRKRKKP